MKPTQLTKCLLVTVLTAQMCTLGCHRGYYRRQADNEAQQLVAEKTDDPRWNYADGRVDIDPQSRMFDPFSQDHPPIPPDDPASHQLMHRVDGKDAYPHWHANGDTDFVENPEWRSYLPMDEEGRVVIDMQMAYELAKLHSPDFQQQRETLYLSALDVSLERFGFDSQLFTGFNSFFSTQGRLRGAGSATTLSTSLGANGGGANLRRLGVTGANFAVGLANTVLWNFAGPNTQSASSLIDFSLIQPLLRDAGRQRILESLTLAERTLLADIRQLDRFRRGFYLEVIMGRNAGQGPGANFLASPGIAGSGAGGFLGLLQDQQNIRIQEFNVRNLETVLDQFREFYDTDRLQAIVLFQFENSVYAAQNALLRQKVAYQNSLDNFKQQLGLPPDLDVVIKDPTLSKFEFISDQVNARQIDIYKLKTLTGEAVISATNKFRANKNIDGDLKKAFDEILKDVRKAIALVEEVEGSDAQQIKQDIETLREARPNRVKYFNELRSNLYKYELLSDIDPSLFSEDDISKPEDLQANLVKSLRNLGKVKQVLSGVAENLAKVEQKSKELSPADFEKYITDILETIPESFSLLSSVSVEFSLLQAQARSDAIELEEVDLTDDQAFAIARCFRRDWMNARSALIDRYRRIEFAADQLEAGLDLVLEGDVGNFGDNPLKIRWENGSLRAGVRFDAPIVRLSERNTYRQTLIQYQQSKRQFYQFRDSVHLSLRRTLRDLNLNKAIFEVNRKAVQAQIKQVDSLQLRLVQPVGPGQTAGLGATAARDLTGAFDGLSRAQSSFLTSWIQFEVGRRNLDFDLGTMQIDELGRWIDPGKIDASIAQRAASMLGVDMECQFCDESMIYSEPVKDSVDDLNYEGGEAPKGEPEPEFELKSNSVLDEDVNTPALKIEEKKAPSPAVPKPTPKEPTTPPAPTPPVANPGSGDSGLSSNGLLPAKRAAITSKASSTKPEDVIRTWKIDQISDSAKTEFGDQGPVPLVPSALVELTPMPAHQNPGNEPTDNGSRDQGVRNSGELGAETLENRRSLRNSPDVRQLESKGPVKPQDKSTDIPDEILELGEQLDPSKRTSAIVPATRSGKFVSTEAGQFSEVDPSRLRTKDVPRTQETSVASKIIAGNGHIPMSALPGNAPLIETTQAGLKPVVNDSLIQSVEGGMLRPISSTVDQLPWDSVQTSTEQPGMSASAIITKTNFESTSKTPKLLPATVQSGNKVKVVLRPIKTQGRAILNKVQIKNSEQTSAVIKTDEPSAPVTQSSSGPQNPLRR